DVAWPELMVIGAVALVAIGPKDLPKAMHTLGKWAGKARAFVQDIQRTFDQLSYEAEIAQKLKDEKFTDEGKTHPPEPQPDAEKGHDRAP
nr:twin-arginine translocase TatA/TatE family subunit [Pseudomonadota bacterium]